MNSYNKSNITSISELINTPLCFHHTKAFTYLDYIMHLHINESIIFEAMILILVGGIGLWGVVLLGSKPALGFWWIAHPFRDLMDSEFKK